MSFEVPYDFFDNELRVAEDVNYVDFEFDGEAESCYHCLLFDLVVYSLKGKFNGLLDLKPFSAD